MGSLTFCNCFYSFIDFFWFFWIIIFSIVSTLRLLAAIFITLHRSLLEYCLLFSLGWSNGFQHFFNRWCLNIWFLGHTWLKIMTYIHILKGGISVCLCIWFMIGLWILNVFVICENSGKWDAFPSLYALLILEREKMYKQQKI